MTFSDKIIALGAASGFGGAWLWSNRIGGEFVASVMAMAGVFLLGALAWRAELWSPRAVAGSIARSAPNREKVAAPLFAVLLLSSAVGAPVGTAAAATTTEDCSGVEAILYDMVTVGEYSLADQEEHPCSPAFQRAQAIEDMENATADQEELDIYNAALSQKANTDTSDAIFDNYLNDSRSVAWMHAETGLAESYKAGDPKALAKSKAQGEIGDYYSVKAVNRLERWNNTVQAYDTLRTTAQNQSGISRKYVDITYTDQSPVGSIQDTRYLGTGTRTMTLPNGSTATYKTLRFEFQNIYSMGDSTYWTSGAVGINDWTIVSGSPGGPKYEDHQMRVDSLIVHPPDGNKDTLTFAGRDNWQGSVGRIQTMNDDLQAEVDPFVNATWTAFQSGEIQASDVISRNNLMFRYGTDALNNSEHNLYDSTAALASMGLASPNISSTGSMTVEYQNATYTGMVLAQEAPNGSWETGTTYNTSNIGGVVLLATTDGQRIDMTGEFTLTAMQNQDGDQIEETQATKVVYKTSNTSELLDKMSRILELRAQIESTKPKAGNVATSDGGGGGIFEKLAAFLGISAGAAAVVLGAAAVLVLKIYSP